MLKLNRVHHIAIICSDYSKSKSFYVDILGFTVIKEVNRVDRESMKLDLALNGEYAIELFSFPNPPKRLSLPEATGLRHIAFEVENLNDFIRYLTQKNITVEPIRLDEHTGKYFTFLLDPDGLPIELYEK